ncbi:MAG TPA: LON peptidase substrate-binding domain-containing protein [Rhizomicrobium sp.]|nr:LON peptidase substrate-binding domain-containing protein [Rhizomicrobium sp.]
MPRHYHSAEEMPRTLPVFPLSGALLLPRGHLPLNIFEPRYLAMADSALAGPRLIAMIQPVERDAGALKPALSAVGCAGRLTSFAETDDGRYLITLTGICRFRVESELDVITPYRQVRANFDAFAEDFAPDASDIPRERVIKALKRYVKRQQLKADWNSVTDAPAETLINALCMLCPFAPTEKQALLEAPRFAERVDTLVALLEMSGTPGVKSLN